MFYLFIIAVSLVIYLVIMVPFILNIQNTLTAVTPSNRKMESAMAWIMIIPVVASVWIFILSKRLSQSIESELKERNIPVKPEPTYMIGLVYGILSAVGVVIQWLDISSIISKLISIAIIVFFIIYWVAVDKYKNILRRPFLVLQQAEQA